MKTALGKLLARALPRVIKELCRLRGIDYKTQQEKFSRFAQRSKPSRLRAVKSEKENQRMIAELEDLRGGPPRLVGWWFPVSSSRGVVY
jgi:hypothetical protein